MAPSCFGSLDLFLVGRHVLAAAAVDDVHLAGAQPPGGARGVDGHVAAADHATRLPVRSGGLPRATSRKKSMPWMTPALSSPAIRSLRLLVGADGQHHGLVAVCQQ